MELQSVLRLCAFFVHEESVYMVGKTTFKNTTHHGRHKNSCIPILKSECPDNYHYIQTINKIIKVKTTTTTTATIFTTLRARMPIYIFFLCYSECFWLTWSLTGAYFAVFRCVWRWGISVIFNSLPLSFSFLPTIHFAVSLKVICSRSR